VTARRKDSSLTLAVTGGSPNCGSQGWRLDPVGGHVMKYRKEE